ncbi:hypothetical protein ACFQ1S_08460 [Kibdelosporangium lantanae]|uniref:Uncharacterized protein n=1 Tax=Kibdelosporangium lantanae TaxID=1497396 RepID=A0ABW3M7J7_9PSEU
MERADMSVTEQRTMELNALPAYTVHDEHLFLRVLLAFETMFALLATIQVDSFRTFRQFTEGASAIQSRNHTIVESLCRRPGPSRLDSSPSCPCRKYATACSPARTHSLTAMA